MCIRDRLIAVQMTVASGVTAMAQTNAVALEPSRPVSVSLQNDGEGDVVVRYLSDMDPTKATVGWGSLMLDQGLENLPLKLRTEDGGTQTLSLLHISSAVQIHRLWKRPIVVFQRSQMLLYPAIVDA